MTNDMNEENKKAPIDLVAIFNKLWPHRKKYYKVLPTVLIGTYLIACLVPRYYKSTVNLVPESSGNSIAGGSLGALASSFGLGSLTKMGGDDAIYSEIYPDLLNSNDFILKLMPVIIQTKDGAIKCSYYDYMWKHQKSSPWMFAKGWIVAKVNSIGKPKGFNSKKELDIFNLTELQNEIFESVKGKIKCNVDKKTGVISIIVQDQDPLVAATMAKETCKKLQDFIIDYRTSKARVDYEYYKKLCSEAKQNYERIRQTYGSYADSNTDVVLTSYKSKIDDLENEMQLRYNVYTTLSTQLNMAQAKLQEATPAFTIITSASVPQKPAGPKRLIVAVAMMIMAFFALSGKLLWDARKLNK